MNKNKLEHGSDISHTEYNLAPSSTQIVKEKHSEAGPILFTLTLFLLTVSIALMGFYFLFGKINVVMTAVALFIAALASMSIRTARQWEKAIILRFGKFTRVVGPGIFFLIPVIESCTMRVDNRMRVTGFGAEETLTSDLVPLNVDAVLFWMVHDAKAAALEVEDFTTAVEMAAQTSLRDAIGRASVAEVAIRRNQLDQELKQILSDKADEWGITILSVEVRNILLPEKLQEIMSIEAQADQLKKARIILAEAEQDIGKILKDAVSDYVDIDEARQLRTLHLLYESIAKGKGTVVIPSDLTDGFDDFLKANLK